VSTAHGSRYDGSGPDDRRPTDAGGDGVDWWSLFSDEPAQRPRRKIWSRLGVLRMGVVIVVTTAAIAGLFLVDGPTRVAATAPHPATPPSAVRDHAAEARLMAVIPRGFPAGACRPVVPTSHVVAHLACGASTDQGGPTTGSFLMFDSAETLSAAFTAVTAEMHVLTCPGGFQSPGPWHRNDAPDRALGLVVCGYRGGVATVAWTVEGDRTVGTVMSDRVGSAPDQSLADLMQWWSSR
jgi:serine/threonine kinase PknH